MRYSHLVLLILAYAGVVLWSVQTSRPPQSQIPAAAEEAYDGPEEFGRFHREIRTAPGESSPGYQPGYRIREYRSARAAARSMMRTQSATVVWTERGPSNVPGRTRGLIVDPDDPLKRTWYAGSAGGGVWKTTNGGTDWSLITPDLSNLATTVLAMAPSNHNIIYLGTGEGFGNLDGISGNGMFKSADRGLTWNYLPATSAFSDVTRLAVSPADPNVVVAATITGIYRTVNGGAAWTQVHAAELIQDLKADPANFNIQYATQYGEGVLKSTDGGQTWVPSSSGVSPNGRLEVAISPVNPNRIFASVEGGLSGSGSDLYMSSDAGATWSLINVSFNNQPVNFLGGQGWYDNTIACDPFNANVIYVGGVNLWRVTLGNGATEVANYDFEENNTNPFLFLQSFQNIQYSAARLTAGPQAGQKVVEIRFGPGKTQKAHRFTVPAGATSGVAATNYTYANYVDVPFEAWEVTDPLNPRQLMASFRDQANNGQFDLVAQYFGTEATLNSREYVYINDVNYSTTASLNIGQAGGHEYRLIYNFFPALAFGATWEPTNLPASTLLIRYTGVQKLNAATTTVSDAYNQYDGKNRFITFGTDVHPDQHNLVVIPMSSTTYKILSASDGGIFVSNTSATPGINQGDWTMVGKTYRTTQFYGADKRPGYEQYLGGTQDNGTWRSPAGVSNANTEYAFCFGGDGFEVIWHNLNDQLLLGGSQGNNFQKSMDGGLSWQPSTAGLMGNHPFISKLANSRDNPDRVYAVSSTGVFYSTDFGNLWNVVPITQKWGGASALMDVEVSRANANIVWAGQGMDDERAIHLSTDAGITFTPTVNPPSTLISGGITKLASHPVQSQTAYALFSQAGNPKILRTQDSGQSWQDISGFEGGDVSTRGFPDVAVYCLYVRPDDINILWAGTEIGIVESTDNGLTWALIPEFPAISVWDMKGLDNQVVIATHGRGIWTATISAPQEVGSRPVISAWGTSPRKELMLKVHLEEPYDKLEIFNLQVKLAETNAVSAGDWNVAIPGIPPGQKSIKVIGYRGAAPIHSETYNIEQLNIDAVGNSYANYFGTLQGVSVNGFSLQPFINSASGERQVLHSVHPYGIGTSATATFPKPVVVSASLPFVFYQDVALVEPGLTGAPFGSSDFYDYVTVEASKNGLDWTALEDGYDANLHPEWTAAFTAGTPGSRALLRPHQLNLLNKFAVGDTLLFRYRLYSNGTVTGWGAALDFITIQEEPTGLEKSQTSGVTLRAFPNPVSTDVTARYTLTLPSAAFLRIVDLSGRVVDTRVVSHWQAGTYEASFSMASHPPGTYFIVLKTDEGERVSKIVVSR